MINSQNKQISLKKGDKPSPPMGRHPISPSASSEPRVHEGQVLPSTPPSPRQPLPLAQPLLHIPSLLTLSTDPPPPFAKTPKAPPVPLPPPPKSSTPIPSSFHLPPPLIDFATPPPGYPSHPNLPIFFKLTSASVTPLTSHCPLRLSEALEKALDTDDPHARLQRDGTLLVTATSCHQSHVLSSLRSLGPHPIACTPDTLRISSKGTIFAPHLRNSQIGDILAYLQRKRVPVTQVYRFPPRRNTNETSNPRLLLTFSTPFPPTPIRLGFTRCSVRTYVPSPRRCYRCQAFGHPLKYCRAPSPRCPNCGSTSHDSCSDPPSCPNCL